MSKPRDESFTLCHEKQGRRNVQRKREHSSEDAKRKFLLNLMEQVLLVGGALKQNISIDFMSSRLQQKTQQFTQFQTLISDLTAAV